MIFAVLILVSYGEKRKKILRGSLDKVLLMEIFQYQFLLEISLYVFKEKENEKNLDFKK